MCKMSAPTYCRLCAKLETTTIHIFEDVGKRMLLQLKILQHLNMKVTAADPLTKHVCILCVGKLDYLNRFLSDCKDAHIFLRKNLYASSFSVNNDDPARDKLEVHLEDDESNNSEEVCENGEIINSNPQFASPEIAHDNTTADCSENEEQQSCKEDDLDVELEVVDGDEEDESNYIGGKLEIEYINTNDLEPLEINDEVNIDECIVKPKTVFDECDEDPLGDHCIDSNSKCDNVEIDGINSSSYGPNIIEKHPCLSVVNVGDCLDSRSQEELKSIFEGETNHELEASSVDDCDMDHDYGDNDNSDKAEDSNDVNLLDCNPDQSAVSKRSAEEYDMSVMLVDSSISELYFRRRDVEDYEDDDAGMLVKVFHCLQNLFDGKCSIMPYFMKWPQSEKAFRVGFKCFCCNNFYFRRMDILDHIFEHLCYSCNLCKEQFNTKSKYVRHVLKSHVIDIRNRKYKCTFCCDIMNGADEYLKHAKQHCEYLCGFCPFHTPNHNKLTFHMKANHSVEKTDCVDCLSTFNDDLRELTTHILKITNENGFVCEFCRIGFHREDFLKIHYEIYGASHGQFLNGNSFGASPCNSQKAREVVTLNRNFNKRSKKFDKTFHRKTITLFRKIVNKEIKCDQLPLIECEVQGEGTVLRFKCPYCCHEIVNNDKNIIAHLTRHLLTICDKCPKLLKSAACFKEHMSVQGCALPVYKCIICENLSFKKLSEYAAHVTLHTMRKMCDYCSVVFSDAKKKQRHIQRVHKDKVGRGFVCDVCGLDFCEASYLKKHVITKHRNLSTKLICPDCGKETVRGLKHKCSIKDDDEEKFICAFCSKSFQNRAAIIPHLHTHMNSKLHECQTCKKRFNRRSSLLKHVKDIHSDRKWKCTIDDCVKSYTFKSALVSHMMKGHKVKKIRKLK